MTKSKILELEAVEDNIKEIVVESSLITPMSMLQAARNEGASLECMQQLIDMQFKFEANEARKKYMIAIAQFKSSSFEITKDKYNKQYNSRYTSIGNLVNTTNAELSKFGLNARWNIDQSNGIKVTCILSHAQGHSEETSMTALADKSGAKNPIQEIKSTITYLKVATYEAITGVASIDDINDKDGNIEQVNISAEQVLNIESLITEIATDKKNFKTSFLKYLKINSIEKLSLSKYNKAIKALEKKRE